MLVLYLNYSPVYVFVVRFAINLVVLFWRAAYMQDKIHLPLKRYLGKVIWPIILVSSVAGGISLASAEIPVQGVVRFVVLSAISATAVIGATWIFGLNADERHSCKNLILSKLKRI